MKTLLFFIFLPCLLLAQNNDDKFYETLSPIPIRVVSDAEIASNAIDGDFISKNIQIPPSGRQFSKLRQFGTDYYLIEFWIQTDPSLKGTLNFAKASLKTLVSGQEQTIDYNKKIYFIIRKVDLENNCKKIIPRGYYGTHLAVTTVPFKIRLKDFDFYTSQTLGLAINARYKPFTGRDFYLNLIGGLNLALVNLDSVSTKGIISGQPINNVGVLSPMAGVVFQLGNIQAGLMLGVDIMNKVNRDKYQWIYNGRPWIGIGLGISILNMNDGKIRDNDLTQGR